MATLAEPETTSIPAKEIKSDKDGPLPTKRKTELNFLDKDNIHEKDDDSNKKQKLEIPSISNKNPLFPDIEEIKDINGAEKNGIQEGKVEEVEEEHEDEDEEDYEGEEEDDDEDEDEQEDDDDDDNEHSNGEAELTDRKGKGIMMDNKGKGKLIEESEDSSDCEGESDSDSDLSDDPLAEVDLDNILPSRTRRHVVRPGVYISKNQGNTKVEDDHSDDSDS